MPSAKPLATASDRPYHHGQLREAALAAARQAVATQGHQALSMRQLAQQLGVAPSALYKHFAHRTALLAALADSLHVELLDRLLATQREEAQAWRAMEVAARTFLGFAQAHPLLFRMMYDDEVINDPDAESRLPALQATYDTLLALGQRAWPGLDRPGVQQRLIGFWSTLFGFATLRAHGMLKSYMVDAWQPGVLEDQVVATALGPRSEAR